jgi:hypothetical protein
VAEILLPLEESLGKFVRFEILGAVNMKVMVLLDVIPLTLEVKAADSFES